MTWPIATGAATVGSSPVGSTLIPITAEVRGAADAEPASARHRAAREETRHAMAVDLGSGAAGRRCGPAGRRPRASLGQGQAATEDVAAQVIDGVLIQKTLARAEPVLR